MDDDVKNSGIQSESGGNFFPSPFPFLSFLFVVFKSHPVEGIVSLHLVDTTHLKQLRRRRRE